MNLWYKNWIEQIIIWQKSGNVRWVKNQLDFTHSQYHRTGKLCISAQKLVPNNPRTAHDIPAPLLDQVQNANHYCPKYHGVFHAACLYMLSSVHYCFGYGRKHSLWVRSDIRACLDKYGVRNLANFVVLVAWIPVKEYNKQRHNITNFHFTELVFVLWMRNRQRQSTLFNKSFFGRQVDVLCRICTQHLHNQSNINRKTFQVLLHCLVAAYRGSPPPNRYSWWCVGVFKRIACVYGTRTSKWKILFAFLSCCQDIF